ncbi:uncharacterized protein EMH_0019040 [Eimeria mitis]|uniref:Uncharacterized protein n=1 Tax=Eimeria mitis TaxID=44415 RepID=U6K822_9EIME|nr:uncharacterized protein EMH_0019040 [Eimeria mitis]CDJ34165.1 hypothetical protein EMH_0019040 [Eimeria mitis]
MQDPEDSVVAHSLYDPHLEPQEADGELEDPSMLPSTGVGYEIEKRDQIREDEAATGATQHKHVRRCSVLLDWVAVMIYDDLEGKEGRSKTEYSSKDETADEESFAADDDESQAEADAEANEEEELQKEEQVDEQEEAEHRKAQPPPPKLPPEEARKLLLSVSISAHAAVPDLLGTKARKDQAEGKSPVKPPLYSKPRNIKQPTAASSAATGPVASSAAAGAPGPLASLPAGGSTAPPAGSFGG